MSGRIYRKGDALKLALLVGGQAVSLGLYKDSEGTKFQPLARAKWLNKKLESFPSPEERVAPPKP